MAPGRKHFANCCCHHAAAVQSAAAHSRSCSCAAMPVQDEAKQTARLPNLLPRATRQGAEQARSTHESLACECCCLPLYHGVQEALHACLAFPAFESAFNMQTSICRSGAGDSERRNVTTGALAGFSKGVTLGNQPAPPTHLHEL